VGGAGVSCLLVFTFRGIAQGVNLAGIAHILELEHRITQLESDTARLMSGHTPPTRTAAGRTNTNTNGEQS
jgi:hypothetical protein